MCPNSMFKQISKDYRNFLIHLVEKGGPEPKDYKEFTAIVNNLEDEELRCFRDVIGESLNEEHINWSWFCKALWLSR